MARKRHQLIGLGGTFDHFHQGHAYFIEFASHLSEKLLIGVTDEWLSQSKNHPESIQSFHQRMQGVKLFCADHNIRAEYVKLSNPYGPTIDPDTKIQAICVTQETVKGAEKINEIRQAATFRPLPVYVAEMVLDETGQEIHSDRIRSGEINREGVVYLSHFKSDLALTTVQKELLHKPLGHLVDRPSDSFINHYTFLVGDTTLEKFIEQGWPYDLAIYDKLELRKETTSPTISNLIPDLKVNNPAGTITLQLTKVIKKSLTNQSKHILVSGEEDLATAALILLAPLETRIYYGQPHQGLVEVIVTEQLKDKIFRILFG